MAIALTRNAPITSEGLNALRAVASLAEFDRDVGRDHRALHRRQAEALSRVAATDVLEELVAIGLLPAAVARRAAQLVAVEVGETPAG